MGSEQNPDAYTVDINDTKDADLPEKVNGEDNHQNLKNKKKKKKKGKKS